MVKPGDKMVKSLQKKIGSKSTEEVQLLDQDLKKYNIEFKKHYSEKITKELTKPQQLYLTEFPTDLSRSTIFFPIPRRGRKKIQDESIKINFKTDWSYGKYEGRKLSVQDEDLLLVLLYLTKKHKSSVFITTYTELQKLLGIKPNPVYNKQIFASIERLFLANFSIFLLDGKPLGEGIDILKWKILDRRIQIIFDNDFIEQLVQNYTLMSLPFRMKIKGDIAKLLFTFLSSHSNPVIYAVEGLVEVLNMNKDHSEAVKRTQLKKAFNELQKRGFLTYTFDKERGNFNLEVVSKKERKWLK